MKKELKFFDSLLKYYNLKVDITKKLLTMPYNEKIIFIPGRNILGSGSCSLGALAAISGKEGNSPDFNIFAFKKKIGRGSYGDVYEAYSLFNPILKINLDFILNGYYVFKGDNHNKITLHCDTHILKDYKNADWNIEWKGKKEPLRNFIGENKYDYFLKNFEELTDYDLFRQKYLPYLLSGKLKKEIISAVKIVSDYNFNVIAIDDFYLKKKDFLKEISVANYVIDKKNTYLVIDKKNKRNEFFYNIGNGYCSSKMFGTCDLEIEKEKYFKVIDKNSGFYRALKEHLRLCARGHDGNFSLVRESAKNEKRVLKEIGGLKSYFEQDNNFVIEMPFIEGKELSSVLANNVSSFNHFLTFKDKLEITISIGNSLLKHYQKSTAHSDLINSNVMIHKVNGKWKSELIDFGVSFEVPKDRISFSFVGERVVVSRGYLHDVKKLFDLIGEIFIFSYNGGVGNLHSFNRNHFGLGKKVLSKENSYHEYEKKAFDFWEKNRYGFNSLIPGKCKTVIEMMAFFENLYKDYLSFEKKEEIEDSYSLDFDKIVTYILASNNCFMSLEEKCSLFLKTYNLITNDMTVDLDKIMFSKKGDKFDVLGVSSEKNNNLNDILTYLINLSKSLFLFDVDKKILKMVGIKQFDYIGVNKYLSKSDSPFKLFDEKSEFYLIESALYNYIKKIYYINNMIKDARVLMSGQSISSGISYIKFNDFSKIDFFNEKKSLIGSLNVDKDFFLEIGVEKQSTIFEAEEKIIKSKITAKLVDDISDSLSKCLSQIKFISSKNKSELLLQKKYKTTQNGDKRRKLSL